MEGERPSISFGFSRKTGHSVVTPNTQDEAIHNTEQTDFVTSLENKEVKSTKPKVEQKELIIPLINRNNWKTDLIKKTDLFKKTANDGPKTGQSDIENLAIQEVLQDSLRRNEDWTDRGVPSSDLHIPLLMQNKVPDGFETDDRLDVSIRPDEPEEANYEDIPISGFGVAMLKGMGWKEGQGIGKGNEAVAPVDAVLRPKGMGLGAERKQVQAVNAARGGNSKKGDGEEELVMKKGAYCLIHSGIHRDLYGKVEGVDEDNARLMVKLAVSGQLVTVSQYNSQLTSAHEYKKYSKYINKGAADRYKEKEARRNEKARGDHDDSGSDRGRAHRAGEDTDIAHRTGEDTERAHRAGEDRLAGAGAVGDDGDADTRHKHRHRHRDKDGEKASRKRKHGESQDDRGQDSSLSANGSTSPHSSLWVRPDIRVRIVDKHYKKGRYYNEKVVVVDVMDRDHCICKTDDGKVLEDVCQSMLETVVPKSDSSHVAIVTGKHKGQIGLVLKRDKKRCEVLLQLLSDRDHVLQLGYDSICQYTGDIDLEFHY